jgi:hypothetical protein
LFVQKRLHSKLSHLTGSARDLVIALGLGT